MNNGIKSCMESNQENQKFRNSVLHFADIDALKKTLEFVDITLDGDVLRETGSWEPLAEAYACDWRKANGDLISFHYDSYVLPNNSVSAKTRLGVKRNGVDALTLEISFVDGNITFISGATTITDTDKVRGLVGNCYGLEDCSVRYDVGRMGYAVSIKGTSDGKTYEKYLSTDVNDLTFSYEQEKDESGETKGKTMFFRADEFCVFLSGDDTFVKTPVGPPDQVALYLFNEESSKERNREAREFVLDCLCAEAPKLRDAYERLSTPWEIVLSATDTDDLVFSNRDWVNYSISEIGNPRFDSRVKARVKNKGSMNNKG